MELRGSIFKETRDLEKLMSEVPKRHHADICGEWMMNGCERADYGHYHTFVVIGREGKNRRPIPDRKTERCSL
jgi:hypothetical protein